MRIIFNADTDVDLKSLPRSAYGHVNLKPQEDGSMGHYFPRLREAELPDELAEEFVNQGVAEIVAGKEIIRGFVPEYRREATE